MARFLSPSVKTTEKDLSVRRSSKLIRRTTQTPSGQISPSGQVTPTTNFWILTNGFWNDLGFWFDNLQWND